ncbi:MAG: hypothetical protein PHW52_04885, partial [Candidatus Pacebacteria bacterium]|nr:hypothetical protein [Candidatus Paceibacterota bacterium]
DATKTYSLEELGSLLQVRSRIKEKTPGESYIYLYPVPNCGKVVNTDQDMEIIQQPTPSPIAEKVDKGKNSSINKFKEIFSFLGGIPEKVMSYVKDKIFSIQSAVAFYIYDPAELCGNCNGMSLGHDYYPGDYGSGCNACGNNVSRKKGTSTWVNGILKYNWTCVSDSPGAGKDPDSDECYAYKVDGSTSLKGQCGAANRRSYPASIFPPSADLCSKGIATKVDTNGITYSWKCKGDNGLDVDCYAMVGTDEIGACTDHTQWYTLEAGPTGNLCTAGVPSIPAISSDRDSGLIRHHWAWCCRKASNPSGQYADCCRGYIKPVCLFPGKDTPCPLSESQMKGTASFQTSSFCASGTAVSLQEKEGYVWHYLCINDKKLPSQSVDCYCKTDVFSENHVACGASNKKTFTATPTKDLCKGGNPKDLVEISDGWSWTCVGGDNETVNCKAFSFSETDKDTGEGDPGPNVDPQEMTDLEAVKKVCKIKVPEAGTSASELEVMIKEECGDLFAKKNSKGEFYDVRSIKVDALVSVVIRGSNDKCLYVSRNEIERSGGCIGELRGSDVYDTSVTDNAVRPKSLVIMSSE